MVKGDKMPSGQLKKRLDEFIDKIGEPYKKVEDVPDEDIESIYERYVLPVMGLDESSRLKVLKVLEESRKLNLGHGKIRQWSRLCAGLAHLLKAQIDDPIDKEQAADIIVRLSRWHHSDGRFYQRFVPWAKEVTALLFGDIENLYYSSR
jgi:hypothetical protein